MYYELYFSMDDTPSDVKVYEKMDPAWELDSRILSAGGWAHRRMMPDDDECRRVLIINDNHVGKVSNIDRELNRAKKLYNKKRNKKILNNYINLI